MEKDHLQKVIGIYAHLPQTPFLPGTSVLCTYYFTFHELEKARVQRKEFCIHFFFHPSFTLELIENTKIPGEQTASIVAIRF